MLATCAVPDRPRGLLDSGSRGRTSFPPAYVNPTDFARPGLTFCILPSRLTVRLTVEGPSHRESSCLRVYYMGSRPVQTLQRCAVLGYCLGYRVLSPPVTWHHPLVRAT